MNFEEWSFFDDDNPNNNNIAPKLNFLQHDFDFKNNAGTNSFYRMEKEYDNMGEIGNELKNLGIDPFGTFLDKKMIIDEDDLSVCPHSSSPCGEGQLKRFEKSRQLQFEQQQPRLISFEEVQEMLKRTNMNITKDGFNALIKYLLKDLRFDNQDQVLTFKKFIENEKQKKKVCTIRNF